MSTINKINNLSQSEFIIIFDNIFEKARWIAKKLYDQKPFNDFEDLCLKMLDIFETTSKENQLKILNSHPDLASKTKISSLTSDSQKEQSNAGLDHCSEEEFDDLSGNFEELSDYEEEQDFENEEEQYYN